MTAPLAPPLTRLQLAIIFGILGLVVVLPFARREDLLGWIAFLYLVCFSIFLWAVLIWGMIFRIVKWVGKRGSQN